jgi:hypothetical protein
VREAIATGTIGFGAYLLLVFIGLRALRGVAASAVVTGASVIVYFGTVAAATVFGSVVRFWPLSATYWFLALCFLMVFGAIYKSISLRILLDLLRRPHGTDRYDAVLGRYIEGDSYPNRLQVMVDSGLAVRDSRELRLTDKGRRLAAAVARLQALYKIERSG